MNPQDASTALTPVSGRELEKAAGVALASAASHFIKETAMTDQTDNPKRRVYVSLVREFLNKYLEVEIGEGCRWNGEHELREWLNGTYRRWWCAVYQRTEINDLLKEFGGEIWTEGQLKTAIHTGGLVEITRQTNEQYARVVAGDA